MTNNSGQLLVDTSGLGPIFYQGGIPRNSEGQMLVHFNVVPPPGCSFNGGIAMDETGVYVTDVLP